MNQDGEISLKLGVARPAQVSADKFRYRFPDTGRRLNTGYSVEAAADELFKLYDSARAAMHTIAGALMWVGSFELKIELAHHLNHFAEGAAALRQRLTELRTPRRRIDSAIDERLRTMGEELLLNRQEIAFVSGLHTVVSGYLLDRIRAYRCRTSDLLDMPSLRSLRGLEADLEAMLLWAGQVRNAAIDAGDDAAGLAASDAHVRQLVEWAFDSEGQVTPPAFRRDRSGPYRRPLGCSRDDRFAVFSHTRRSDGQDFAGASACPEGFQADRLALFRVQRDELDAIETFANILYDLGTADLELQVFLARLISDEARHSEMGQHNLRRLGFDPFEVPCGVIGINVRSPLPPQVAFAQISVFGELNQIGALRSMADWCAREGDELGARSFDFTHADEFMHLRSGRKWLQVLAEEGGETLQSLTDKARRSAIRRLHEEGVVDEDYRSDLSDADIAALIGE